MVGALQMRQFTLCDGSGPVQPNLIFFFLMKRGPPKSTLFPYTPPFRSTASSATSAPPWRSPPRRSTMSAFPPSSARPRSEEHTSELQSHLNLVCRLLLEKKKLPPPSPVLPHPPISTLL